MKPKVFITKQLPKSALKQLRMYCEVSVNENDVKLSENEIIKGVHGKDGLICLLSDTISSNILESNRNLRIVANFGVGYNNINVEKATELGIMVTNTPGVLDDTTAELAFALIFAVYRRVVEADYYVRQGKWTTGWEIDLFQGYDIHHKTLGIIGLGNIGKALAKKTTGFSMKILYHNRKRVDNLIESQYHATYTDMDTLLKESDIISLHVPLTPDTHHLIGRREFALIKKSAILINTARGPVVDEKALYEAVRSRSIWGAGLDVFEEEPRLSPGLTDLNNVVLLPHIGSASVETRTKMAMMVVDNLIKGVMGQTPPNIVMPLV